MTKVLDYKCKQFHSSSTIYIQFILLHAKKENLSKYKPYSHSHAILIYKYKMAQTASCFGPPKCMIRKPWKKTVSILDIHTSKCIPKPYYRKQILLITEFLVISFN